MEVPDKISIVARSSTTAMSAGAIDIYGFRCSLLGSTTVKLLGSWLLDPSVTSVVATRLNLLNIVSSE